MTNGDVGKRTTTRPTSEGRTFDNEPGTMSEHPITPQRQFSTTHSGQLHPVYTTPNFDAFANRGETPGPAAPGTQRQISTIQSGRFYPAYPAQDLISPANGPERMSRHAATAQGTFSTTQTSQSRPAGNADANPVYPNAGDTTPNVIVFGESGVGKSSLINMITGMKAAATSNEAIGCTFQSSPYNAVLHNHTYRVWDTIGLNEGNRGTASADRAIDNLQRLVQNLKNGGVSLLVYCIRGARIRDIIKINYDLFYTIICNKQVPIVLVITGLENEDDMEDWWRNNSGDLANRGLRFHGHACVTSTKGKLMKDGKHMFEAEYSQSAQLVRELIVSYCPEMPWKPDGSLWLLNIVEMMNQMFLQNQSQGLDTGMNAMARSHQRTQRVARYHDDTGGIMTEIIAFFRYLVMYATMARRS